MKIKVVGLKGQGWIGEGRKRGAKGGGAGWGSGRRRDKGERGEGNLVYTLRVIKADIIMKVKQIHPKSC